MFHLTSLWVEETVAAKDGHCLSLGTYKRYIVVAEFARLALEK